MVHMRAKPLTNTKLITTKYKDSKYPKDNREYLGYVALKNIDIFSKQVTSGFTDIDRCQNLASKIDSQERVVKSDSLSILKNLLRRNPTRASFRDLDITLGRIKGLSENKEEDEYGEIISPTEYANIIGIELVSEAAKLIPAKFFKAWVSTEDSGGVSLTWSKPELAKEVRLVIPSTAEQKIYLYHEKGKEYGVEYNVSAKTLSHWLRWCSSK